MSEMINNSKVRQEKLKEIIRAIHDGMPLEEAKAAFKEHFDHVSTAEISQMEQALIKEGMGIDEIQRLCDVHAALFEGSISDIHKANDLTEIKGHPVWVFLDENKRISAIIEDEIRPFLSQKGKSAELMLRVGLDRLMEIDKHYARKEHVFFPYLEKKGIDGPPKVMWAKDDEIRTLLKEASHLLSTVDHNPDETYQKIDEALTQVTDMIVKENHILIPLLMETLGFFDWVIIDQAQEEMGFFLERPDARWTDQTEPNQKPSHLAPGDVQLDCGLLPQETLSFMLNALPFDMTFVDANGHVKYFTQGKERIFDRPKTILGRHVSMCHPPQSVHIVETIIESFRSGKKDHEDFWIPFMDKFVHIRYFAVRDHNQTYLGTLEVTQDIKPIRDLEGQKRLIGD